jgi:hypothetical protein
MRQNFDADSDTDPDAKKNETIFMRHRVCLGAWRTVAKLEDS